ncbi:MAG: hypothetical protein KIG18_00090 [Candidatus Methanomethylophilaceae archaeon]|nr:hypothetical protein [Candidatus Methanomethylophilaceae archaeon]
MVRISLKEAYDDRSVIKKIADLEANKQDKLTAGQGVTIDGTTISVDTSDLATKAALNAETARLDQKIDDVDAKIPPLASKAELANETARLDQKIDNVDAKIPPLASKAELSDEVSRLDAEDRDLSSRIDASNVKIKTNADAIHTIEDELGSDALPGTIYYRIAKVENDVITLKPLVNDSIKSVDVEGDASTVYHRALHNSGIVENDALPVASDTKAGVMSASMYVGFNGSIQNLQARMAVLEGVGITYQLTGLPDNATSEQITAAFQAQYPNVPLMAGIRAADYDKAKIWQYSGTAWIQLTSININVATSSALGLVKGSETSTTNEGKIFVEVDGSMTVIGWDTLKALASAAKQSVDNLEPKVTQQSAKIDALEGDVAANAADITALQGTSANHESRISSLETTSANLGTRMGAAETDIDTLQASDAQQTSKISSLETTSANLGTRMGTAETDIDTLQASDSQQTSKISALEADMNNVKPRVGQLESDVGTLKTKVDQHTQSISGLSTDVNAMKTGKQDKLIAGQGITIADDGKTIAAKYAPQRIEYAGKDDIFSAFQDFLINAAVGESFEIWYKSGTYASETVYYMGPSPFVRFGNSSSEYVKLALLSPLVLSSVRELDGTMFRTFYCQHAFTQTKLSTSGAEQKSEGTLSLTFGVSSNGTLSSNGGYIKSPSSGVNAYSWKGIGSSLTNLIDNTAASAKFAYINKP